MTFSNLKVVMNENGIYFLDENDNYHNPNGGPAIIGFDGYKAWYIKGNYHNSEGGPSRVLANGVAEYYENGMYKFSKNYIRK